jgi:hypothetical protein
MNVIRWHRRWLKEAMRVMKPGATLFAFAGTRTDDLLKMAARLAGFEMRDTLTYLYWCFGSGFPKAQDLGALIDKAQGAKREVVGHSENQIQLANLGNAGYKPEWDVTAPATPLAREWDGWKVGGIKPAYEPILWARKPCEGSTMANVLKFGVGAFNADAGRVGLNGEEPPTGSGKSKGVGEIYRFASETRDNGGNETSPAGRFPPNLLLDENLIPVFTLTANVGIIIRQVIEEYYANYNLPRMWKRVSNLSEQGQGRTGEVLLKGVLLQGDEVISPADAEQATHGREYSEDECKPSAQIRQGQPCIQGALSNEAGLSLHTSGRNDSEGTGDSRQDDSEEPSAHSSSQAENGDALRPTAEEGRGSSPQKRRKGRQPNKELGDTNTSGTRESVSQDICRIEGIAARERRLEILACDIPSGWLRYFEPAGYSLSDPTSAAAMLDEQSGELTSGAISKNYKQQPRFDIGEHKTGGNLDEDNCYGDTGGASRFFPRFSYTAKVSRLEREIGLDKLEIVMVSSSLWENQARNLKLLVDTAQSPPKVIAVLETPAMDNTAWSSELCGKPITAIFPKECAFIIETATSSITTSPTLRSLTRLLTSDCTAAAKSAKANGGSPVGNAESSSPSLTITSAPITSRRGVSNAVSPTRWTINGCVSSPAIHPTCKPIRLMRWLIELVTREGDTILDPLCGSGSTGCAATWTGRKFIGIEKEVEYHAIAEARVAYWALQAGREYADVQAQWDADSADYPLFAE